MNNGEKVLDYIHKITNNKPLSIAFMPYKTEMWDCMQSIYRASVKDDLCLLTNIIPLPYFYRCKNYWLEDKHIDKFTKYDKSYTELPYDYHYDIIFIHNPYDNNNMVTSIDPQFYSTELINHCDRLVYVPYFCCGDSTQKAQILQQGVYTATDVIVENEANKEQYINTFKNANYNIDENKFVVIPSPKYDLFEDYNKLDIDWIEKMFDNDGKRKNIVLLNISLVPTLNDTEKTLNKLQEIIDIYYKDKNVCLWFRPHPLLLQTLKVMRSEALPTYCKIIEDFVNNEKGIYDDTPYLHRAIMESNELISQPSSIIQLWKHLGQPENKIQII